MHGDFCTFIHQKCELRGTLHFEGTTRVDGKLVGEVYSHHLLVVGPEGVVDGDINVGALVVYGCVRGNVLAHHRVEAKGDAVVEADVQAPIVHFEEGVRFDGQIKMSVLKEDSR